MAIVFGKILCVIRDVKVLTGTMQDSFFVLIEFLASDSTAINITCWKDYVTQRLLGCSIEVYHYEFVTDDGNDGLLSSDELNEMTDLLKSVRASSI